MARNPPKVGDDDYRRLLALRTGLRRFLRWSETQAQAAGITPMQHQMLLAIRGHDGPRNPTVGEVADYLLLRHHSVVELAQRTEAAGLIERIPDSHDKRVVRLRLTTEGTAALQRVSALNIEELSRLAGNLRPLWQGLPGHRLASEDDAVQDDRQTSPVEIDSRALARASKESGALWALQDPSDLAITIFHLRPDEQSDRHAAADDTVFIALAGRGQLVIEGNEFRLRAGVLVHIPRGDKFGVSTAADSLTYALIQGGLPT